MEIEDVDSGALALRRWIANLAASTNSAPTRELYAKWLRELDAHLASTRGEECEGSEITLTMRVGKPTESRRDDADFSASMSAATSS